MAKKPQTLDPSHELPSAPHLAELEGHEDTPRLETEVPPKLPTSVMTKKAADVVYPTRGRAVEVLKNQEDYPADAEGTATA